MTKKKELEVLWKVVDKERKSIVINRGSTSRDIYKDFVLTYLPGTIVKSKRGSYGCFCFKTSLYARNYSIQEHDSFVIRVVPKGKIKPTPKLVPEVRLNTIKDLKRIVKKLKYGSAETETESIWSVPDGTICCMAVEVLD
jgi:hypothetical protein